MRFCTDGAGVSTIWLAIMRYWAVRGRILSHDRSSEDNLARNPAGRARAFLGRAGDVDNRALGAGVGNHIYPRTGGPRGTDSGTRRERTQAPSANVSAQRNIARGNGRALHGRPG